MERVLGMSRFTPPTAKGFPLTPTCQRIFQYADAFDYALQGIACLAAVASGAGIALQNLIFGRFVTVITDYALGVSSTGVFLDRVSKLAYGRSHYYVRLTRLI